MNEKLMLVDSLQKLIEKNKTQVVLFENLIEDRKAIIRELENLVDELMDPEEILPMREGTE